jgi:hypothetical protein
VADDRDHTFDVLLVLYLQFLLLVEIFLVVYIFVEFSYILCDFVGEQHLTNALDGHLTDLLVWRK